VLRDEALKKRFLDEGVEVAPSSTPEEFGSLIRSELAKWAKVVRNANIK
jgi:tripartite-type tricarboxylate transporter receptor subunit TctC